MQIQTKMLIIIFSLLSSIPIFSQSAAGNAISLDGIDDFAVPNTPNVSGLDEGTIEIWFSVNNWSSGSRFWCGGSGLPGSNYDWVVIGTHSTVNSFLSFGIYGPWRRANSEMIPDSAQWYHVACTWGSDGMKIYVDGELKGEHTYTGSIHNYSTELFGASTWGINTIGYLDEIRIWNFARDSVQINSTMMDTLTAAYYTILDSGLIAYYRMDVLEDLGINGDGADDLRDLSVSGNHADSYGDLLLEQSGAFLITNVDNILFESPIDYILIQNYPNPFNPATTIKYQIPEISFVTLKVYDVLGSEIITLVNEEKPVGIYEIEFDATELPSGIYFYRLQSGSFVETKKMILLK